jgi:hypothetical protein
MTKNMACYHTNPSSKYQSTKSSTMKSSKELAKPEITLNETVIKQILNTTALNHI